MTAFYIFAAVVMFGILITVHEAGHFFAARVTGIPVREFSVGFGPSFFRRIGKKHGTAFHLRLIPLGGYCAFFGEDELAETGGDDPRAFARHSVPRRLLVIVMGAVMNLALAYVAALLFYTVSGVPELSGGIFTQISAVVRDSPAEAAGLLEGDRIVTLNGFEVTDNLPELVHEQSLQGNLPLHMVVERAVEEEELVVGVNVMPLQDPGSGNYRVGIEIVAGRPVRWRTGTVGEVLGSAYTFCWDSGKAIILSIQRLLTRGEGASEMTGVVGIMRLVVEETRETQLQGYLSLMALISINLGLFNMLPIPGLDGSKLLFLTLEAIRGKPIKREAYVHAAGMILLFGLMVLISFRDILRLFQGGR